MSRSNLVSLLIIVVVVIGAYAVCQRPHPSTEPSGTAGPAPAPAPTAADENPQLTAVIDELIAKYEALEAFSAETELNLAEAAGMAGATDGRGHYKLQRTGGKTLLHFATENRLKIDRSEEMRGKALWTHEYIRTVYDGEHIYRLVHQHKFRKVFKRHYDPSEILHLGGRELFDPLRRTNELKLLPEDLVDDKPTYVIQATPFDDGYVAKHWFDKETGIRLRVAETDDEGMEHFSLVLKNVGLNPEFEDDTFAFVLPDTYDLVDETRPQEDRTPTEAESTQPQDPAEPEREAPDPDAP